MSSYAISIKWTFEVENQQEKDVMGSPYGVRRTLLTYQMLSFLAVLSIIRLWPGNIFDLREFIREVSVAQ